ncbi:MAG: TenA family protein [Anaerolineae bacterium]|nr:TenA family protein [Thermoflexus sp.]MDW8064059.1 TenA family protein [Anaerolineae bacterium]
MMRSQAFWKACYDLVQVCEAHPFVRGIASGELPRERFAFYIGQDAFFLDAFARAYALALAKAPDRESMGAFRKLLNGVFEELALHQGYAVRWGVDLTPEPAHATRAYTDFLLRVAALEPVGHIVAAMTPCMRLYAHLGRALYPHTNPESPYREWVETYASADFERLASQLEELLDRLPGEEQIQRALYRTAMELEACFFDAAWKYGG